MSRLPRKHRVRTRGGWVMLDLITGLLILLVLMTTLTAVLVRQHRGEQKLANTRAAVRMAEQTATALQLGQAPPTPAEGDTIEIAPVQSSAGKTPAGQQWVRIQATISKRTATLVALTPSHAATTKPATAGGSK